MPVERRDPLDITVRVTPRASKSEVVGYVDGVLRVRIAAPPVNGAANEELIRLIAKQFGVAKSGIHLVAGLSSRTKRVRIESPSAELLKYVF